MAELKTNPTEKPVDDFINAIPEKQRPADAATSLK
jgi:hypothetical protein